MVTVVPFQAVRPVRELAGRICEPPYDTLSTDEARALAAGNPLSFLHVSRPEIDLPELRNPFVAEVYETGAQNFSRLIASGALRKDSKPCFYVYRQRMAGHCQTGLVATISCKDYLNGFVKRHELTHPTIEQDRTRHIEALNAQTGPAFLIYRAVRALDELVACQTAEAPEIDFVSKDGVQHCTWTIADPAAIALIEAEFKRIPCVFIADGHHRTAAAVAVWQRRKGAGTSGVFLGVLFPHDQVQILPYNRVLRDLNGLTAGELLKKLSRVFKVSNATDSVPSAKHQLRLYLAGQWYALDFSGELLNGDHPIQQLDVMLLQRHVLGPVFGIDDPSTNDRIAFIGGIRGTVELKRLVDSGEFACAFSMFPVSVEELMAVADSGSVMPPKSTWFEPKLRDGLFCHLI